VEGISNTAKHRLCFQRDHVSYWHDIVGLYRGELSPYSVFDLHIVSL
jgi:hypothetical protein